MFGGNRDTAMIKLAIDLGSSVTKIYRAGSGVVLAEPTCIAVATGTREIRAIGKTAKRLIGSSTELLTAFFPIVEAEIVDAEMATILLRYFLRKVGVSEWQARRTEVVFGVPCGASDLLLDAYVRLASDCGLGAVHFVEVPFLAALGQNLELGDGRAAFMIEIGGGSTNIAALSLEGIASGIGLNLGSGNLDSTIAGVVADVYGLRIGLAAAENLKQAAGSLYRGDSVAVPVSGRGVSTGRPRTISVSSRDIVGCVRLFADRILQYTALILQKLPQDTASFVLRRGIRLSGGGACLVGLDEYCSNALGADVRLAQNATLAVVLGGGRAIENAEILHLVSIDA